MQKIQIHYAVHWLSKRFTKPKHLITLAVETDILEILVRFIKNTEYTESDVVHFQECVNDVSMELHELIQTPGAHFLKMEYDLTNHLSEWVEGTTAKDWHVMREDSTELYLNEWREMFEDGDDEDLKMFSFFSMRQFRSFVTVLDQPPEQEPRYLIRFLSMELSMRTVSLIST